MLTVIFLIVGVFVVGGGIYLAVASGNKGGRNGQSSRATATAVRQEKVRVDPGRASGGDD